MLESFGARLRRRREEQQIALATIAEQTKIKVSLLEALERDDVSHWPSGIFRRAFIRAYAHSVGLNPDAIVAEFLELYPDPIEDLATAFPIESGAGTAQAVGGPPTRLRYMVGSAIESLSRLRRAPSAEDPAVLARGATNPPASSGTDLPAPTLAPSDPAPHESMGEVAADSPPANSVDAPAGFEPDVLAAADLCTELGRVDSIRKLRPLLEEAARILDATGLIVWLWDDVAAELRPALSSGYSDRVIAQLPRVGADADNLTAAAFRSGQACAVKGGDDASGSALVVPMMTPTGCAGVLAMELQRGGEESTSVRAVATIFAAQLAHLAAGAKPSAIRPTPDVTPRPARNSTTVMFRGTVRR
jgi:cytoskeleton protein RodZ